MIDALQHLEDNGLLKLISQKKLWAGTDIKTCLPRIERLSCVVAGNRRLYLEVTHPCDAKHARLEYGRPGAIHILEGECEITSAFGHKGEEVPPIAGRTNVAGGPKTYHDVPFARCWFALRPKGKSTWTVTLTPSEGLPTRPDPQPLSDDRRDQILEQFRMFLNRGKK